MNHEIIGFLFAGEKIEKRRCISVKTKALTVRPPIYQAVLLYPTLKHIMHSFAAEDTPNYSDLALHSTVSGHCGMMTVAEDMNHSLLCDLFKTVYGSFEEFLGHCKSQRCAEKMTKDLIIDLLIEAHQMTFISNAICKQSRVANDLLHVETEPLQQYLSEDIAGMEKLKTYISKQLIGKSEEKKKKWEAVLSITPKLEAMKAMLQPEASVENLAAVCVSIEKTLKDFLQATLSHENVLKRCNQLEFHIRMLRRDIAGGNVEAANGISLLHDHDTHTAYAVTSSHY